MRHWERPMLPLKYFLKDFSFRMTAPSIPYTIWSLKWIAQLLELHNEVKVLTISWPAFISSLTSSPSSPSLSQSPVKKLIIRAMIESECHSESHAMIHDDGCCWAIRRIITHGMMISRACVVSRHHRYMTKNTTFFFASFADGHGWWMISIMIDDGRRDAAMLNKNLRSGEVASYAALLGGSAF
mgnify:CR=1 FL=1